MNRAESRYTVPGHVTGRKSPENATTGVIEAVAELDALLLALQREAERPRPKKDAIRELSASLAWGFEPLRAILTGEPALPDLRHVTTGAPRAPRGRR